jgi:hypothetical protein
MNAEKYLSQCLAMKTVSKTEASQEFASKVVATQSPRAICEGPKKRQDLEFYYGVTEK